MERSELECPCCQAQFVIEYDHEKYPDGPSTCPFCEEQLLSPEDAEMLLDFIDSVFRGEVEVDADE